MSEFDQEEFRSKGPELLVDLAEQSAALLVDMVGMELMDAAHVGQEIARRMAFCWGGQNVYFPMGLSYNLLKRDRQIYAEFTGTNHSELARKHRVSLQWIYKIVKAVRREEIARRQGALFPSTEPDIEPDKKPEWPPPR